MTGCNCKSYNAGWGDVDEVILPRPDWLPDGVRENGVPVDACISNAIQALWGRGLQTLGCCCGHNRDLPSIVIPQNVSPEAYFTLLLKIDGREWKVQQWQLVDIYQERKT